MKQYIQYVVHNHRARTIAIIATAVIVFCAIFFSFRAQALDTKLEPTICTGDWGISGKGREDKKDSIQESSDIKPEEQTKSVAEEKVQSEDISSDIANTEPTDTVAQEDAPKSESIVEKILALPPIFSAVTQGEGSITCSSFVTPDDLTQKALTRNLNIVMTVSSPDGYEEKKSMIVEISNSVRDALSSDNQQQSSDENVQDNAVSDTTPAEELNNSTTTEENTDTIESTETIPEESVDIGDTTTSDQPAESSTEPVVFLAQFAYAQETDTPAETESVANEPSAEPTVVETSEVEETPAAEDVVQQTEEVAPQDSGTEDASNPIIETAGIAAHDESSDTSNEPVAVDTGIESALQPVFSVDASFDNGVTWGTVGNITWDMIPQNPTEISLPVPINDPLFWMHIDRLQVKITRVLSGDSSDSEITLEYPHFVLDYDDTAVMPDFSLNSVIDIKSIGDLTVFVLEHNQSKERTLWTFQSTGTAQWTKVSSVEGISSTVPIGLKSIYLFWVTADNKSVQGYDTSSKTNFGATIDHDKAQLPFGSGNEVVVYKNKLLSFRQGLEEESVASDNDATLVDFFIKEYVDVAREMQTALQQAIDLQPKDTAEEESVIHDNSIISAIADQADNKPQPLGSGETIIDLPEISATEEAVVPSDSSEEVEVSVDNSQFENNQSEQSADTITESF